MAIIGMSDPAEREVSLKSRLVALEAAHLKFRKLSKALAGLAIVPKPKQLALIASATKYLEAMEIPAGVKPVITIVANELVSLGEGIAADLVTPTDLVLTSGLQAVTMTKALIDKTQASIARLQSSLTAATDPVETLLLRNKQESEKIPAFNGKEFLISRAPVAFTFQNKSKHSSVGYVDTSALDMLGFKSENLEGYTILHNQLILGISSDALFTVHEDAGGNPFKQRIRTQDSVVKFKAGKPTPTKVTRDADYLDVAKRLKLKLEAKTKQPYSFVSEHSAGYKGGHWFWLMPTRDLNRLARAFPGGHAQINKWGFAF